MRYMRRVGISTEYGIPKLNQHIIGFNLQLSTNFEKLSWYHSFTVLFISIIIIIYRHCQSFHCTRRR